MKILYPIIAACAVALGASCGSTDANGRRVYNGPSVGFSLGWNDITVGVMLHGREPLVRPQPQPQTQVPLLATK